MAAIIAITGLVELAGADSQVNVASGKRVPLSASAHVDFRVVLPSVLALHAPASPATRIDRLTAQVSSNQRSVVISASPDGHLLVAPPHRTVERSVQCAAPPTSGALAGEPKPTFCTVAIP